MYGIHGSYVTHSLHQSSTLMRLLSWKIRIKERSHKRQIHPHQGRLAWNWPCVLPGCLSRVLDVMGEFCWLGTAGGPTCRPVYPFTAAPHTALVCEKRVHWPLKTFAGTSEFLARKCSPQVVLCKYCLHSISVPVLLWWLVRKIPLLLWYTYELRRWELKLDHHTSVVCNINVYQW